MPEANRKHRRLRRAAAFVAGLFGCGACGYLGMCAGYFIGTANGLAQLAPSRAMEVTVHLRSLRRDDAQYVIDSLESELDSLVLRGSGYDRELHSSYGWLADAVLEDTRAAREDRHRKFMGIVKAYRQEFPSQTPNRSVRAAINRELASYPALNCPE